jgi:hypothetical protein
MACAFGFAVFLVDPDAAKLPPVVEISDAVARFMIGGHRQRVVGRGHGGYAWGGGNVSGSGGIGRSDLLMRDIEKPYLPQQNMGFSSERVEYIIPLFYLYYFRQMKS